MKKTATFCLLFLFYCSSVFTQDLSSPMPLDPQVTSGVLENGFHYYIRENHKPENRAQLWLAVNAGSILEDDDQQGLAHLIEHMAFNGTEHFAKQEIIDFMETIGMSFGPEVNAYTGFDETVYMLEVPTDSLPLMETAFQILEDWAHLITFEPEEVDKERGVVIEEWRQGQGANRRILNQQLPILLKDSKYARRLPIGQKDVVDTCHYETIHRFYNDWYRPDLMALVAVGDFEKEWVETRIKAQFQSVPKTENPRERITADIPDHRETLFAIATDPEVTSTQVSVYFKFPPHDYLSVGDFRRNLMVNLYDAMLNERLSELTQKPDPPFLYGYSGQGSFVRNKGVYTLSAAVKDGGVLRGLDALLTEAYRVRRFGFTPSELTRTRLSLLRRYEMAYNERDKSQSTSYANQLLNHFLQDRAAPDIAFRYEQAQSLLPGISLDELNAMAQNTIIDTNRVIAVSGPEKEGVDIPDEAALDRVFSDVKNREISPYEDAVLDEPLLPHPPKPGSLVSTRTLDDLGVTEWTLSNGVRVVLKPTDFKNDEIRMQAFSFGGNSKVANESYISSIAATAVAAEGGVGQFDQIALRKKLTGKIVRVSPYIGEVSEGLSGFCSPKDLETLFQLVHLRMTAPRKDSTAYQAFMDRMHGFIQHRSARPETAFSDTIQVTLANYHFRARPWTEAILNEVDLNRAFAFYQERYADCDDFVFFFVGNLNLETIKPLVLTYLASLPGLPGEDNFGDPGVHPPRGVIEKTVRRGVEPKGRVQLAFTGPFDWTLENRYVINSMISLLQIKLREVVREDKSGTYGVNVSGGGSLYPRQEYALSISFGCDPARVDELVETVFSQIDSLQRFGPDELYVSKVTEAQLRDYETNLKENAFWISQLKNTYFSQIDPHAILEYPDRVKGLTAGKIQNAVTRYFNFDNYVKVVLLPEDIESEEE